MRLSVISCFLMLSATIGVTADNTWRGKLRRQKIESSELTDSTRFVIDTLVSERGGVRVSGYEKPLKSAKESLFVTNSDSLRLVGLKLRIDYLDEQSRQLHQRTLELECDVPGGETRQLTFPSWDKQKTLYYYLSPKSRTSNGTPFKVKTFIMEAIFERE